MYDQALSRDAQAQYGSREDFIRTKGNVRYHWFEIEEIQVEGDSGTATVKYAWNHNVPTAARPEMKEIANREPSIDSATDEWILEDGEWRRKRVSINPFRNS